MIQFLFALQVALVEYISYNKKQKGIILFSLSWFNDSFLLCSLQRQAAGVMTDNSKPSAGKGIF